MPFHHEGEKYLTTAEAATEIGVASSTLRGYLNHGVLPEPLVVRRGKRRVRAFTQEWISGARDELERDVN